MRNTSILLPAAISALVLSLPSSAQAVTYTWNVAGTGTYFTSTNWTPARTSLQPDDVLVFNNGATNIVTNVIGGTIGQLLIASGTSVELRANGLGSTITIAGGTGTDLDLPAGAALSLTTNSLSLAIGASATGAIGGTFTLGGSNHRISAAAVDGLIVQAGGQVRTVPTHSGSPFGQGTGASALNSVRFQAGSVFLQEGSSVPFGAIQPNSVVVFDHGSRYIFRTANLPNFSGRTYADFEYDVAGTFTNTGNSPCTFDSVIVTQGTLSLPLNGAVHIKGSIRVQPGALLSLGTGSGGTTYLDGAAPQYIRQEFGGGGIAQTPGHSLVIDNPAGVHHDSYLNLRSNLHFLQGLLKKEVFGVGVDLDSTGTVTNASQSTGWVASTLLLRVSPAMPVREYAVGTETSYSPMTIQFGNLLANIRTQGSVSPGTQFIMETELDPEKVLNLRHGILVPVIADTANYDGMLVTTKYQNSDLLPGTDPTALVMRVQTFGPGYDPWRSTTPFGPFVPNQVTAMVAEPVPFTGLYIFTSGEPAELKLSTVSTGSALEGGGSVVPFDVKLSQRAIEDTVRVDYTTADSTATVADNDYVPVSGTLVFLPGDTLKTVNVTVVGDATPERYEIFQFKLSDPESATVLTPSSNFIILDDDDVTPPTVQVTSPNGGEVKMVGAQANLTWTATDNVAVRNVTLWVSRNAGSTWTKIIGVLPNSGSYLWTVTGPPTTQARFRVDAIDDPGNFAQDVSDADWTISNTVGVDPISPTAFALALPMPTPTSAEARLTYALPRAARVQLTVHDIAGRVVETLVDEERPPGRHEASWNASRHAAGLYLVRMRAGEFTTTRRIVVTR